MAGFVNRVSELEFISDLSRQFISAKSSSTSLTQIVHIIGEGGIGKTRLLQQLPLELQSEVHSFDIIDICDFDDRSFHIENNFELWLLSKLSDTKSTSSERIRSEFRLLQKMKERGDSQLTLGDQQREITNQLLQAYSAKSRILRFDTVEKLSANLLRRLCFFIGNLENALVIVAGRFEENESFVELLLAEIKDKSRYHRLELKPFEVVHGEEYIHKVEAERNLKIPNRVIGPLLRLSNGKPILIDLAIEYVSRSISIDPLLEINVSDFDKLPRDKHKELQDQFEAKLVEHISNLSGRMDRLILLLSRIYPLTLIKVAELLNISLKEAEILFTSAQGYVFIKTLPERYALDDEFGAVSISLQDVMRELVQKYVWDKTDPQERRRKRDSRMAVEIYKKLDYELHRLYQEQDKHIKDRGTPETWEEFVRQRALEQERELVTETWIEHSLFSDLEMGFLAWKELLERVRKGRKFEFAYRLSQLVKDYYKNDKLAADQLADYLFVAARADVDKPNPNYISAEKEITELLESEFAQELWPKAHNLLGVIYRNLGRLPKALYHQQRALDLFPEEKWWERANIENQIGNLYRLLEDHDPNNLDQASKFFENVRLACSNNHKDAIARGIGKANKTLLGGACSNLGYVRGLQNKYERAERLLNLSIEIFESAGRNREIAWPETNLGIIARDAGRYEISIRYLNRATHRLRLPDDHKELCRAYFHLGWTQWFKAFELPNIVDIKVLENARELFLESLEIADRYSYNLEKPGIYHQLATVTWLLGLYNNDENLRLKGRELNKRALDISRELNNIRYAIDALVGEMEFDLVEKPEDYTGLLQIFEQIEKEHNRNLFSLYFGRAERILGDCAFINGELAVAFLHYEKGFPLIAKHGGYGPYSLNVELDKLGDTIQKLSQNQAGEWIEYLADRWSKNIKLRDWCDAQLMRNQLRES